MIDRATITKVYSGKPGCGCGCRGRYYTDSGMITSVVNRMNASEYLARDDNGNWNVETDKRYLWAYPSE